MNTHRYLRQMGVPVWRLRSQHKNRSGETDSTVPVPAAKARPEPLCLRVGLAPGAPGQTLVDELLQALRMLGLTVEVRHEPETGDGMWLGELPLPGVGQLLAQPAEKAALWQTLMQWLETHGTGGAHTPS